MFEDTIAAIATPLAPGAISIIRLSGDEAVAKADALFSKDLIHAKDHSIHYGYIEKDGKRFDEVLVSVFRAPRSYTTEDVVEINCHGGVFVTRQILGLLLAQGVRLARPGEFTERAFLHGRIDLSQAEAVQDLIDSSSSQNAHQALNQVQGSVRKTLEPLIDELMDLIANIEVNIDYPEYDDVEQLTSQTLLPKGKELLSSMQELIIKSRRLLAKKNGLRTAIIGRPNVGKSSLLNSLLDENKAIVTEIPGTTRDLVEGQIYAGSVLLQLIDTAGIRQTVDEVEKIGVQKSLELLDTADLILLVLDGSRDLSPEDFQLLEKTQEKNRLILINKSDLPAAFQSESLLEWEKDPERIIRISADQGDIDPLLKTLEAMEPDLHGADGRALANDRQIGLMESAAADMMNAVKAMETETETDLIEIDLVSAHDHLKEILGEVHREDLLDTLFSNFCLGK